MEQETSIRINLNSREFEIKGNEEFISKYDAIIESFLLIMKSNEAQASQPPSPGKTESPTKSDNQSTKKNLESSNGEAASSVSKVPDSFGEFYNKIPKAAKDVDKILAAGYFVQLTSGSNSFSTREASTLLVEQGVKLSNPSAFMKSNFATKKVFKHQGNYRVSESGAEYVKQMLSER